MYGQDILWSKGTFEIQNKISYPYIVRCIVYWDVEMFKLQDYEFLNAFEMSPQTIIKNSCLLSPSWQTTCLEKPHNSVVPLYRFHCTQLHALCWIAHALPSI